MNAIAIAGKRSPEPDGGNRRAVADIFEITTHLPNTVGAERPPPEARLLTTIYENVLGRTPPKVRPKIAQELRAVAELLDSQDGDGGVAVVTSKRRGIEFGRAEVRKIKVCDGDESARKIGINLAKSEASVVFVDSQAQLNKLFKILDGEVTIPGKRGGLELEAIITPKKFAIPEKYERHADLIISLEAYGPEQAARSKGKDQLRQREAIGIANADLDEAVEGIEALTLKAHDRRSLRRALRKEREESIYESLDSNAMARATDAPGVNTKIKPEKAVVGIAKENGLAAKLVEELPAGILSITSLPSMDRKAISLKPQTALDPAADAQPSLATAITNVISASSRVELPALFIGLEELEERRKKFLAALSVGGADDKIAAFAISNNDKVYKALASGQQPSQEALAWKNMHDATITPQWRQELQQRLFEGVTAVVFAPREATVSPELQSLMDFLEIPMESAEARPAPRGKIMSNLGLVASQEPVREEGLMWQLEVAA